MLRTKSFKLSDLVLIESFEPENPPLNIGELCRLNSGGPSMKIEDVASNSDKREEDTLYVTYGSESDSIPRACVRRVNPLH